MQIAIHASYNKLIAAVAKYIIIILNGITQEEI